MLFVQKGIFGFNNLQHLSVNFFLLKPNLCDTCIHYSSQIIIVRQFIQRIHRRYLPTYECYNLSFNLTFIIHRQTLVRQLTSRYIQQKTSLVSTYTYVVNSFFSISESCNAIRFAFTCANLRSEITLELNVTRLLFLPMTYEFFVFNLYLELCSPVNFWSPLTKTRSHLPFIFCLTDYFRLLCISKMILQEQYLDIACYMSQFYKVLLSILFLSTWRMTSSAPKHRVFVKNLTTMCILCTVQSKSFEITSAECADPTASRSNRNK